MDLICIRYDLRWTIFILQVICAGFYLYSIAFAMDLTACSIRRRWIACALNDVLKIVGSIKL